MKLKINIKLEKNVIILFYYYIYLTNCDLLFKSNGINHILNTSIIVLSIILVFEKVILIVLLRYIKNFILVILIR